jgi:hypothetical protein
MNAWKDFKREREMRKVRGSAASTYKSFLMQVTGTSLPQLAAAVQHLLQCQEKH